MNMSTEKKVALVTGGTKGLGLGLALALVADGWTVVVCGRTPPDEADPNFSQITFLPCDVRKPDQIEALMQAIQDRHGRLDLLVNNAGGSPVTPAATASPRFSQAIIDLNLTGPLNMARLAHPRLSANADGGSIINIASISGLRPSPGTAAYGAAKAGLLSLNQALALEWGPTIRVNAIVVGLLITESSASGHYGGDDGLSRIADSLPMKRLATNEDVAAVMRFLLSPAAAYMSGAQIAVHGGGEKPAYVDLAEG